MANVNIKYLAIYGMADTPNSPSSVARLTTCDDPAIYTYEICNPRRPWLVSNNIARYFIGFDDGGYDISEKIAMQIIEPWRTNWPQPKHQTKAED